MFFSLTLRIEDLWPLVCFKNPHQDLCVLLTLLDEALQALSSIRSSCFPSKTQRNGCENGTLTAAVVPDDEVDQRPKSDLKVSVTHEIGASHSLDDAIISRPVIHGHSISLLCEELGDFELVGLLIGGGTQVSVTGSCVGDSCLLSLCGRQFPTLDSAQNPYRVLLQI